MVSMLDAHVTRQIRQRARGRRFHLQHEEERTCHCSSVSLPSHARRRQADPLSGAECSSESVACPPHLYSGSMQVGKPMCGGGECGGEVQIYEATHV